MKNSEYQRERRTPLFSLHQRMGGKIVDFNGWAMPLHYGSQLQEHYAVRQEAGVFDVSHMAVIDVVGDDAQAYLRWLLANDVAKMQTPAKALYSPMLNEEGGILDDLIVYYIEGGNYRIVVNSVTASKDLDWMIKQAKGFDVSISHRQELAIIAVQGPKALAKVQQIVDTCYPDKNDHFDINLTKSFTTISRGDTLFARTGYTGEDGVEIILPDKDAPRLWESLVESGVVPCGLGARDTLRLEAGLNLYGAEMDESTRPSAANLNWCTAWQPVDRNFCGRAMAEKERDYPISRLVGVILKERGVLRSGQTVCLSDGSEGVITSGTFSPTLNCSIALARVPVNAPLSQAIVKIRNKALDISIGSPCFVRKGHAVFKSID